MHLKPTSDGSIDRENWHERVVKDMTSSSAVNTEDVDDCLLCVNMSETHTNNKRIDVIRKDSPLASGGTSV